MRSVRDGDFEAVTVTCLKRSWVLPGRSAWDWILAVSDDEDMARIFPGMIDDGDSFDMFQAWKTVPDMHGRCVNVARAALGRVAGRDWWWARNMIHESVGSWTHLNGHLVRQGVVARKTELPDWLDAAYTQMREMLKDTERTALDMRLRIPPRGVNGGSATRAALLAFAAD